MPAFEQKIPPPRGCSATPPSHDNRNFATEPFNQERHLVDRQTYWIRRSAAMAEWQLLNS